MGKKAKSTSFKGQRVTPAGKRYLEDRAPKLRENPKSCIIMRGSKTSELSTAALKAVAYLKAPHGRSLNRRRENLRPLEDASAVEAACAKHDCAFFAVGSHSKKRPHNVVLGRTYDGRLLDAFEFGVAAATGDAYAKLVGSKPLLTFVGDEWEADEVARRLKNFFADFLRGPDVDAVNLAGLDQVYACGLRADAGAGTRRVTIAPHRLRLTKAAGGGNVPDAALAPSGPPLVLDLRRDHKPALELWKVALKQPKALKARKKKNVKTTSLGDTVGRIHLGKQRTDELQSRKVKALRKPRTDDGADDDDDDDAGASASDDE